MNEQELQWSPEFLNRIRAQFTDEEWESAWIETWNSRGSSGKMYLFNDAEAEQRRLARDAAKQEANNDEQT